MHSNKTKLNLSIIFSVLFGYFAMAQGFSIDRKVNTIDSLIQQRQFDNADKKASKLQQLLDKNYGEEEYVEQRIRIKFLQGKIKDEQFMHSSAMPLFLEALKEADENKFYKLACQIRLSIASNQEAGRNYTVSLKYLKEAQQLAVKHKFNDLYSNIFLKYATLYRFVSDTKIDLRANQRELLIKNGLCICLDSSRYYANRAIEYAKKYNNDADANEGNSLLGIISRNNPEKIKYFTSSIPYLKRISHYDHVGVMYTNIADIYRDSNDYTNALKYSDSSLLYYNKMTLYYKYTVPESRSGIFEALGNVDSAYHYYKLATQDAVAYLELEDQTEIKQLEEKYQNDKKEATIQSKDRQMLLVGTLLAVIVLGSILLFRQNRKINSRNRIINKQLAELSKTLEQKQVLLSELQHRVKNNLQHVISILEIQKESVDFNNIDELIRGNQNRIHSMALLHKKLNISDSVNEVSLEKYLAELSQLVKESYDTNRKKVTLSVTCDIDRISIEKALPLGLIIVELISNSMKYAFKKQHIGIINISLTHNGDEKHLYYSDNGIGFDFHKVTKKGLGLEIINGLIDQIDGTAETKGSNGFELEIFFY